MRDEISNVEQIVESCQKISTDLSVEQQMAQDNENKVEKLKDFTIQNCNEICSNASSYAESLKKTKITGLLFWFFCK